MGWYLSAKLANNNIVFREPLQEFLRREPSLQQYMKRYPNWQIPERYEVVQYQSGDWAVIDSELQTQIVRLEPSLQNVLGPRLIEQLRFIEGA